MVLGIAESHPPVLFALSSARTFLAGMAVSRGHVRTKPFIHPKCGVSTETNTTSADCQSSTAESDKGEGLGLVQIGTSNERGDLLICRLWATQTECVLHIRVTDTDAKFHQTMKPDKVLAKQEREKKA